MTRYIACLLLTIFVAHASAQTEVLRNPEKITAKALDGVKLLELAFWTRAFDKDEVKVVRDFVKEGGSVLVIIDEERRTQLLDNGINVIMSSFGMKFTANTEYLHNCGALAKAGLINAADREIPYSGGRAVEGGTPFAWRLNEKGELAETYGAYVQVENGGRVIALAEGMASIPGLGSPEGVRLTGTLENANETPYWGKDWEIFMREVRGWLIMK